MSDPFVDADVIVRLITGDDPAKQSAARALFDRVSAGELTLTTPVTTIADVIFVLTSSRLYRYSRGEASALVANWVRLPHLQVPQRGEVLRALEVFGTTGLDFGDAFIVASMEELGSRTVFSYDRDFDRMPGVERIEPPATDVSGNGHVGEC